MAAARHRLGLLGAGEAALARLRPGILDCVVGMRLVVAAI